MSLFRWTFSSVRFTMGFYCSEWPWTRHWPKVATFVTAPQLQGKCEAVNGVAWLTFDNKFYFFLAFRWNRTFQGELRVVSLDIYGHLTTSTAGKLKIISRLYGHLNIKLMKLLNGFWCPDDIYGLQKANPLDFYSLHSHFKAFYFTIGEITTSTSYTWYTCPFLTTKDWSANIFHRFIFQFP